VYPIWIPYRFTPYRFSENRLTAEAKEMREPGTLEFAMQMVDRFGVNAELETGDEMDRALEVGDAGSFDKWRLIAETIAALSRRSPTVSIARNHL
jgi:hypothetical protein